MIIEKSYEATYPRYPFAPLVHFGITIAAWLSGRSAVKGSGANSGGAVGGALGSAA